jgi:hypothetical protein
MRIETACFQEFPASTEIAESENKEWEYAETETLAPHYEQNAATDGGEVGIGQICALFVRKNSQCLEVCKLLFAPDVRLLGRTRLGTVSDKVCTGRKGE